MILCLWLVENLGVGNFLILFNFMLLFKWWVKFLKLFEFDFGDFGIFGSCFDFWFFDYLLFKFMCNYDFIWLVV